MGWQWHQMDYILIICISLHTDNNASNSSLDFYRPNALPDTQPRVPKKALKGTALDCYKINKPSTHQDSFGSWSSCALPLPHQEQDSCTRQNPKQIHASDLFTS